MFTFNCGDLNWSGQGFQTAIVGFNSQADFFVNHPANGFPDIAEIVSCRREIAPPGRRKRVADGGGGSTSNQIAMNMDLAMTLQLCLARAGDDDAGFQDLTNLENLFGPPQVINVVDELPACPPTLVHASIDPMFQAFPEQTTADAECFRSTQEYEPPFGFIPTRSYTFVSVCCYSNG